MENESEVRYEPVGGEDEAVGGGGEAPAANRRYALPVGRQLAVLGGLLTLLFVAGGASVYWGSGAADRPDDRERPAPGAVADGSRSSEGKTFAEISLAARSALVIDVKNRTVLYEKEPDLDWPLASITKLMTALVAREIVREGEVIPITAAALEQSGDSGFALGERFSYRGLSDLILLTSSNDGAYALAAAAGAALDPVFPEAAFVRAMNVRARELGLDSTSFRNPTGLDLSEDEAGAYGTARDVAKLMEYILREHPDILEGTTKPSGVIQSAGGGTHEADNTNRVVGAIATVLGSKTGYTTLAGGNLVVAFDAGLGRPVVAVVLGSTHQGRFADMLQLVEASRTELNN